MLRIDDARGSACLFAPRWRIIGRMLQVPPVFAILAALVGPAMAAQTGPLVIAHRGASGYLPEHTLEAAAYAHALGADFIEQDVVLSRDGVLVVCHDIHVDTVTDVAARFPDRGRGDGRFYAIDFTWEELRSLRVRERVHPKTQAPAFPRRFPSRRDDGTAFRLCTLDEQIALIQGLNRSTGRDVGIYVEFKEPAWHAIEGHDLGAALLDTLRRHGFTRATDPVFVQCFDPVALRRLREELHTELRLVQLIGDDSDDEEAAIDSAMRTPAGLAAIARYAQGIGPHLSHIVAGEPPALTSLVTDAHAAGLLVHPYTFRADALPEGVASLEQLMELFVKDANIDGLFIDQPDAAVRWLARNTPD